MENKYGDNQRWRGYIVEQRKREEVKCSSPQKAACLRRVAAWKLNKMITEEKEKA